MDGHARPSLLPPPEAAATPPRAGAEPAASLGAPGGHAGLPGGRAGFLLLGLTLAAGVALRSLGLAERSLWFDEAFSWRLVQFPFWEMLQRNARDTTPPLHYVALKLWSSLLGDSPVALRSLSVLCGGATILGMYLFILEAFRAGLGTGSDDAEAQRGACRTALLAAALVAFSAFHIRYSWEARMYAMGTALAVFSSWALLRALRGARRAALWWLLYGVLALLFLYTHYYALFSVVAQAAFLLGWLLVRSGWDLAALGRQRPFRGALLAAAVVALGWLPWLPVFLQQRARVQADFWIPPLTKEAVLETCYRMFVYPEAGTRPSPTASLWAADLCLLGLLLLGRKARAGAWFVLCAAVVPIALGILASALDTPLFTLRYLLFAHLFLLAGLAVVAARVADPLGWAVVVFLVTASLWAFADFWERVDVAGKPGYRGAAEFISRQRRPDEPVVVCSPLIYPSILYHSRPRAGMFFHTPKGQAEHYAGGPLFTRDDFLSADQLLALRGRRVWVVNMVGGYWGDQAVPVPPSWVAQERREFPEVFEQGKVVAVAYEPAGADRR
jgi:mannosyltransferase